MYLNFADLDGGLSLSSSLDGTIGFFNSILNKISFCSILGSVSGDLALTIGARGGVFIAGGIAPDYLDLLHQSDFRARFLAKGRFAAFNRDIPTFIVKHPHPGLLGTALLCRA